MNDAEKALRVARERADRTIPDPVERHRFMVAFRLGQRFESGHQDSYAEYQRAMRCDDSATVAGLIEGQASVRSGPLHADINYDRKSEDSQSRRKGLLSRGERAVLMDAAQGLTARESGDHLGFTLNTINSKLSKIRAKLGARNTAQAITIALIRGEFTLLDLKGRAH